MFRKTLTTAAATFALAAGLGAVTTPSAQADLDLGTPQVSADTFRDNVVARMNGRAFGWQLAIAQDGKLALTDKRGTAVSQMDTGGSSTPMQPTMRMELASVTKNITAVATMKLLRRNSLSVESLVYPYLPDGWVIGNGFEKVRFRHLLTHTSGLNQAITAMANPPTNNGWDAMKTVVANGTTVDSQRQYKNANFAILRIVNAELWNRSGGKKYVTEVEEFENDKGVVIKTVEHTYEVPITAANHTSYVLEYMRKYIFEPAGLYGIGCIPQGTTTGVRSYPLFATQAHKGTVLGTSNEECAGARGIAMSAVQLVQYLAHLRHGSIIAPADLATMDKLRAGWAENANGFDGNNDGNPDNTMSPGVFWHGGALLGDAVSPGLHTCAMTFADGTEAALLVNSELTAGDGPCGVLIRAYRDAQP